MPWPVHPNGLLGAQGDNDGYRVERSLRFNSADSAYLNRTLTTPTSQSIFTLSLWVKLGLLGTTRQIFGVSTNHSFGFTTGDALNLTFAASSALTTTALFRDPSAWYHIVWTQNGTSHTLYVNGVSVGTATATSNTFNTAVAHQLGAANTSSYFNGYITEANFIDGQALTPSSFGQTDATTGRWKAKAYSGTYGTNGFYLKFADNSNNTATTLGKDSSPNGNNWTPNNFSVTAGAGNDSLVDSPTNYGSDTGVGGEVRGNYATLSGVDKSSNAVQTNGNLDTNTIALTSSRSSIGISSGKWYCEVVSTFAAIPIIGVTSQSQSLSQAIGFGSEQYGYYFDGKKYNNGTPTNYGNSWTTNDVIGVALNMDSKKVWFAKNGTWQASGNPSTGVNEAFSGLPNKEMFFGAGHFSAAGSSSFVFNFGQRPFAYTAPTGFKALCTTNLIKATAITTSGSFVGNVSADGPFVYLNGIPTAMTINGNAVTFGSQADKLSNGFKVRTTSTSYNSTGTNNFSVSTTAQKFKYARAQAN